MRMVLSIHPINALLSSHYYWHNQLMYDYHLYLYRCCRTRTSGVLMMRAATSRSINQSIIYLLVSHVVAVYHLLIAYCLSPIASELLPSYACCLLSLIWPICYLLSVICCFLPVACYLLLSFRWSVARKWRKTMTTMTVRTRRNTKPPCGKRWKESTIQRNIISGLSGTPSCTSANTSPKSEPKKENQKLMKAGSTVSKRPPLLDLYEISGVRNSHKLDRRWLVDRQSKWDQPTIFDATLRDNGMKGGVIWL